ncbi:MAG: hypothetical protein NZ961_17455, partial [Candidatus Poribacteria bacterium]|nr:hypothetical protein [Candidatus Poribacteria bacterium]
NPFLKVLFESRSKLRYKFVHVFKLYTRMLQFFGLLSLFHLMVTESPSGLGKIIHSSTDAVD